MYSKKKKVTMTINENDQILLCNTRRFYWFFLRTECTLLIIIIMYRFLCVYDIFLSCGHPHAGYQQVEKSFKLAAAAFFFHFIHFAVFFLRSRFIWLLKLIKQEEKSDSPGDVKRVETAPFQIVEQRSENQRNSA